MHVIRLVSIFSVLLTTVVAEERTSPTSTASAVDRLIQEAEESELRIADDATFLRRISLDLIGRPATVGEITQFGLNPSADKRQAVVTRLLDSDEYATNWSRYWRDAIFLRATNIRAEIVRNDFEEWMAENLAENRPWSEIVTDLLTATGPVNGDGSTALIFAHEGESEEIAAEASRLFLGIQIQCANCHNHPWDRWKREQFHELAAFFPRVSVRRDRNSDNMFDYEIAAVDRDRTQRPGVSQFLLTRLYRNRDKIISEAESKNSPLARIFQGPAKEIIDKNGDGRLSIAEIMTTQPQDNNRPGQGATEHYMANLADPSSNGDLVNPAFFVTGAKIPTGQTDLERRNAAASLITSKSNPWFAKAIVNRIWSELTSSAFYTPIDDIGPDRAAEHEAALEQLASDFTSNNYDIKWLMNAITQTKLYQRAINTEAEGFVRLEPTRLRADQLYDSLCQSLNVTALPLRFTGRPTPGSRGGDQGRLQFSATFGFDPSTPKSDLTGAIPEALFLMNSPQLNSFIKADSANSLIARISQQVISDEEVVHELYLRTVGREPTSKEVEVCMTYLSTEADRKEGFEDILWTLFNSSEFQSKS